MITEGLLGIVFAFVEGILSVLPNVSWTVNVSFVTSAVEFLACVFYVLPMTTVFAIITILCALQAFRVGVAVIKTIWDLLPIL